MFSYNWRTALSSFGCQTLRWSPVIFSSWYPYLCVDPSCIEQGCPLWQLSVKEVMMRLWQLSPCSPGSLSETMSWWSSSRPVKKPMWKVMRLLSTTGINDFCVSESPLVIATPSDDCRSGQYILTATSWAWFRTFQLGCSQICDLQKPWEIMISVYYFWQLRLR